MKTLSPDTSPEAERVQIELLRRAGDARRINMLAQLNASARELALLRLREQHPRAPLQELLRRLADQLYGEELMHNAVGAVDKERDSSARAD